MAKRRSLGLKDVFYALLLDEICNQPNLRDELGANELGEVVIKAFGTELEKLLRTLEKSQTGLPFPIITGPGYSMIKSLFPPPRSFLRDAADILAMPFGSNYDALCRSALLHLFWGETAKAERKVNLAKHNHDNRAFAHHVYGLTKGLEGDAIGARFELHLALERENLEDPRQRIERGLRAVDWLGMLG